MTYTDVHASRLGTYAGFVTRLIAWIIDHLVISGAFFIVGWIGSFVIDTFQFMGDTSRLVVLGLVVLFNFLFYIFYFIGLWMLSGQTLGKYIMGLRIVRTNGERLKFRNAVVRFFGVFLSALMLYLGYIIVLFDNRRQAIHDKLAGTIVVYSENWEERAENDLLLRNFVENRRKQRLAAEAAKDGQTENKSSVSIG
jgi:uncharacterized RDD family membrane protein YckC